MEKENTSLLVYQHELKLLFYKEISTSLKKPLTGTRSVRTVLLKYCYSPICYLALYK